MAYLLLFIAIILPYIILVLFLYKLPVYSNASADQTGITLFNWPKKNTNLPYNKIEHIFLKGTLPNYPGYTARLGVLVRMDSNEKRLLTIPISAKCAGLPGLGYQVGVDRRTLEKIIQNVPKDSIDPNLIEFVEKGEIGLAKISKAWGASFFKLKLWK